jgi:hypothetical protein
MYFITGLVVGSMIGLMFALFSFRESGCVSRLRAISVVGLFGGPSV